MSPVKEKMIYYNNLNRQLRDEAIKNGWDIEKDGDPWQVLTDEEIDEMDWND